MEFEWTDELVKEFCNWFTRIPVTEVYKKDRIVEFKHDVPRHKAVQSINKIFEKI